MQRCSGGLGKRLMLLSRMKLCRCGSAATAEAAKGPIGRAGFKFAPRLPISIGRVQVCPLRPRAVADRENTPMAGTASFSPFVTPARLRPGAPCAPGRR